MLETLGMRNVQKILPLDEDKKPVDPVSENMNIMNMKPVKAFLYQDHDAHLAVHVAMAQDPVLAQALGQNPQAQVMSAALQAHIAEHLAFQYRQKIEQVMGAALPPPDAHLPEVMEIEMSRVAAQAAQMVTGMSKQQMAAIQAQQAQQDPVVQMQQQELQLKAAEVQRKAQKDEMDAQLRAAQIATEQMRIETQAEIDGARLGAQIAKDKTELEFRDGVEAVKQEIEGTRMGIDLARSLDQSEQQAQRPKKKETK